MKPASIVNLQHPLPEKSATEHFQTLLERPGVRLERIVSDGQVSPPGFWFDQAEDEWVLLLTGAAALEYGDGTRVELGVGDALLIPAGYRHRVAFTAPRTVWLALFCAAQGDGVPR
ncbi:cupin domain-containing protein [Uliginosibacterium sp. 31-16]|uniref:cupin domain-containing protein n=1 Tax=Uliginosibacterium sp. 31-16 TaxID=3068315 RepID=UPI00273EF462|nr:cupin domain-containing protein [Uliginosibacterium sp. 31-16]MDP5238890.1 cupin domain-containing protein [Uliginosibacterium sp. 31-16]